MKFKKIVFVRYMPLTKSIYEDLYFEALVKNNIEVEYLDVTELFFKRNKLVSNFKFDNIFKCNNYKELKEYLKHQDNSSTLYISIMTFEWRVLRLFRIFTRYNLFLGVFARGVFPITGPSENRLHSILKLLNIKLVFNKIGNIAAYFAKKYHLVKKYDYIFRAGEFGYQAIGIGNELDFNSSTIIEVNTVDYDKTLLDIKPIKELNDYIVFIDQYLPYHPDTKLFGIKTVDANTYYENLNMFFKSVELQLGKEIVIACHPKAESYKEKNPYENRKLLYNQTNELVKYASYVFTHLSTAICFNICYNKNVILLNNNQINKVLPIFHETAKKLKIELDASVISTDTDFEISTIVPINPDKFNEFKYKYLTSINSENVLSEDIVLKFFIN